MNRITKLLSIILLTGATLLASCSTAQLYYQPLTERPSAPWKGSSSRWGGYVEERVSSAHYKIGYEAYNRPTADAAKYFTLIRAAERTVLDGKRYFYVSRENINSVTQNSHFPAYVTPGHYDRVRRSYYEYDCHGNRHKHYRYIDVWCPPEYFPARDYVNYIHTAKLNMKYSGRSKDRYDAHTVLYEALSDRRGFGKPDLDPRVMAAINTPVSPR